MRYEMLQLTGQGLAVDIQLAEEEVQLAEAEVQLALVSTVTAAYLTGQMVHGTKWVCTARDVPGTKTFGRNGKMWKGENSGATRFQQPAVQVLIDFASSIHNKLNKINLLQEGNNNRGHSHIGFIVSFRFIDS